MEQEHNLRRKSQLVSPSYHLIMVRKFFRFHEDRTAGASPDLEEEEEESSDGLLDEITASPPRFECNHGEDLEDDPQLTLGNMKKFQANV